ncbi:KH domain-containing protein HEN4 isoform X2 [Punica granatum]|uniref:KH domain-containing protein HEN4 isoform X2 n=1 Tax=Punica granatum TaxID=22663 RepID=A0A6P8CVM1_PUNGR|nr:KH domain-containing protein HEN4 isoform X2 [Punica granatum]
MEASPAPAGPPPPNPSPPPPPQPPPPAGPVPSTSFAPASASSTTKPTEASFRILCPATKTAKVPRDIPGAKIRVLDEPASGSSCEERVILVYSHSAPIEAKEDTNVDLNSSSSPSSSASTGVQWGLSSAQQALVRVFESVVAVAEDTEKGTSLGSDERGNADRTVVCRLLAGSSQVGSAAGREGRLLEKIRQENPVSIGLVPRDQLPPCASLADELIEISGNISAVKQALLSASTYLHENPGTDPVHSSTSTFFGGMHSSADTMPPQDHSFPHRGHSSGRYHADYHKRNYSHGPGKMAGEEEVLFKLLCQQSKVGSLIGKGGSVVRAIENDTGAYIKIGDNYPDSDERIVTISARENPEHKGSPAQEAVMRVHHRIAEIGFEPGNPVVARLLVPSPQIRYLLGKGGSIINEMRRGTGANIRISPKDQSPRYANIDEVVQVMGNVQVVEDALFHITSRIREYMLPKPPHSGFAGPPYKPPFSDMPPPHFRPRHNPHSPGPYPPPPPGSIPHGVDGPIPPRPLDHQPPFPRPPGGNFGSDGPGYGPPPFDRPPSPRMWGPQQPFGGGNPMGPRSGPHGSGNQGPIMQGASVEVVIPQTLLGHVHGENDCNLIDIRYLVQRWMFTARSPGLPKASWWWAELQTKSVLPRASFMHLSYAGRHFNSDYVPPR